MIMHGRTLLLALTLLVLASCSAPPAPLRIGLLVWPPYELVTLARSEGWLGRDVRIVEYHSPSELTRAFRNGLLDAVFVTSHISLRLAATGTDHRIIYVIDFSRGGDALVARDSVPDLAHLRGRVVGVEPSALGAYVLGRALDFAGLERTDIDAVPVDVAEQADRWRESSIDALVCYEPVKTRLLEQGAHVLFDSNRIPDEIADVLITREALLKKRQETLQGFISSLERSLDFYQQHRDRAVTIMASRTRLSPRGFRMALAGAHLVGPEENRRLLGGDPPRLLSSLDNQVEVMRRNGLLDRSVDLRRLIDGRFVCGDCRR